MTGVGGQIAFAALAALTLVSGLFVVSRRNLVHAGYWLLPCFIGVAGLFATLEADFLFVAQLLIYAGAILVLVLFALMLTRDVMDARTPQTNRLGPWAALFCAAGALAAAWVLTRPAWAAAIPTRTAPARGAVQTRALGDALIGPYAIPFEVSSLLLLAALVGAVVLARSAREPEPPAPPLAESQSEAAIAEAVVESEREAVAGRR